MRLPSIRTRCALRLGLKALAAAMFTFATPLVIHSQSEMSYILQGGSPSFSTAVPFPGGFVNVANGNVYLEIQIASYPQRGGHEFETKLVYNSRLWRAVSVGAAQLWHPNSGGGGWGVKWAVDPGYGGAFGSQIVCSGNNFYLEQGPYSWTQADGTLRIFPIFTRKDSGCGVQNVLSGDALALDGSGFRMFVTNGGTGCPQPVTVYDRSGNLVWSNDCSGNKTIRDVNGNKANYFYNPFASPPYKITDTYHGANSPIQSGNLVSFGVTQTFGSAQFAPQRTQLPVATLFGMPGTTEFTGTIWPITGLSLPDGTGYSFSYDCDSGSGITGCGSAPGQAAYYGLLKSVTLPTGGTVSFEYANTADANGNVNRWVTSVTYGGGTWTFSVPQVCGPGCQTVTVTKPNGEQSLHTFSLNQGNGAWNTSVQHYAGAVGGSPVLTVVNELESYPAPPSLGGWAFTHPKSTTTTLASPGGTVVKKTSFTFDTISYSYQGSSYTGSAGKLLSRSEYAFGNSGPGVLVQKAVLAYLDDVNPAYRTKNILDRVTNAQVQDAAGTKLAETRITYDSTPLTPVSLGSGCWDDTNYGTANTTRGNPTVVERWIQGNTYLSTILQYDVTGQLIQTVDPKGNITSFGYSDAFQAAYGGPNPPQPPQGGWPANPGGCQTNAFLTSITVPLVGTSNLGYHWGSGKLAYTRDPNGAESFEMGPDSLDRMTHSFGPLINGNRPWALTTYNGANLINTYSAVNSTQHSTSCTSCVHEQVTLDGLGRMIAQSLVNDPQGATHADTAYDVMGRVLSQSNPYRTTLDSTYGVETFAYDSLSRTTLVTHHDGNTAQTFYGPTVVSAGGLVAQQGSTTMYGVGYPTLSVDEAGKAKQTWTDALGRLIEVDELEPGQGGSTIPATPGTGSVTINGSEQSAIEYIYVGEECILWSEGECIDWGPVYEEQVVWDSGGVSITVNGFTKMASYGQSSTGAALASALASAFNLDANSPVTASTSGNVVNLVSKVAGTVSNYPLSATSWTDDPSNFSNPSFTPATSGSSLTGGADETQGGIYSPANVTLYRYDAAGNLIQVDQGSQTRTYVYDGLSRVTSSTTPESGTTVFHFTTSGGTLCSGDPSSVCRRVDARNITTTYTYDALNRSTQTAYSDGTPTVTMTYDQGGAAANALGRLTSVTDASGTTTYTYDSLGRITTKGSLSYQYNLAGDLTTLTYPPTQAFPSGRQVVHQLDAIGRPIAIQSGATSYVSNMVYNAAGSPVSFTLGNGVDAAIGFNNRLQLTSLYYSKQGQALLSLGYRYKQDSSNCPTGSLGNNGQIQCINDFVDNTRSTSYLYDPLGRLKQAEIVGSASNKWVLGWTYDQYGNRLSQSLMSGSVGSHPTNSVDINPATNRITTAGYTYDAAGNMTSDGLNVLTYDAENRIQSVNYSCTGGWPKVCTGTTYKYDAGGRRIQKEERTACTGGGTNIYTTSYDYSGSSPLREFRMNNPCAGQGTIAVTEYVYAGSQLMAYHYQFLSADTLTYVIPDHLSARVITNENATTTSQISHYPFGEAPGVTYKWNFTSYEKDAESGNHYAMARYHANRLGRFLSPDPLAGRRGDPQSLNRYSYVRNDPVNFVDPSGLDGIPYFHCCSVFQYSNQPTSMPPLGFSSGPLSGVAGSWSSMQGGAGPSGGWQNMSIAVAQSTPGCTFGGSCPVGGWSSLGSGFQSSSSAPLLQTTRSMYSPSNFFDPSSWWSRMFGGDSFCSGALCMGLLRGAGNFASGATDVFSFGLTSLARKGTYYDDLVDENSVAYNLGEWSGIAINSGIGAVAGLKAAGTKAVGREFSHWIPNRMGGPRSIWNGNYISPRFHYLTDPYRYPKGWRSIGPKWNPVLQQLGRIPFVYYGAAAGATTGAVPR